MPVVACGVGTDARAAVAAIRAGAKEYIPLPPDPELIAAVLAAVADDSRDLVYRDDAMAQRRQARRADRAVRRLDPDHRRERHRQGSAGALRPRASRTAPRKPFISVNCAAIPENLLECELFGHEKGAFTGAIARRIGKFEEADGGTLLLDEISEMDVRLQAKLLRASRSARSTASAARKPVPVDIRIIATSNRDLAEAVRERHVPRGPALPPQRREPAAPAAARAARATSLALAEHFVAEICAGQWRARAPALRRGAPRSCCRNRWPGNVRELENTMHRAVLLAPGAEIGPEAIRTPDGARLDAHAPRRRSRTPRSAAEAVTRGAGRPHRRRRRARPDPRHARPLPRQPHARRQHPRHLDPHAAQQAQRIFRRRRADPAARRRIGETRRGVSLSTDAGPRVDTPASSRATIMNIAAESRITTSGERFRARVERAPSHGREQRRGRGSSATSPAEPR